MPPEKRTPEITTLAAPSQLGHFLRLFLPLALLLGAIAFTLVSHDIDMRVQQHIHKEEATLEIAAAAVYRDMQTIRHDIDYLSQAPAIADFFAHPQRVAALEHLDQTLRAISQAALFYDQVCLLDLNGREISRVNRRENNSHIVPRHELQQQGQPAFPPLPEAMAGGNIAISPLDLGRKQNKPIIRFMAMISDSQGEAKGFLVVNYLADSMLANLRKIMAHSPADFLFLDQDGGSLQTPEPAAAGGSLAGNPALFAHRQPEAWHFMHERASGVYKADSGLTLFRTVFPTRLQADSVTSSMEKSNPGSLALDPDARRWLLVSTLSSDQQQAIFHENFEYAYFLLLILLIILAMGCLLISKGRLEKQIATTKNIAIANSSYDAIIMMDHHGKISFWNPAAERIFGYTASEIMGQEMLTIIAPSPYRQDFSDNFPQFIKSGRAGFIGQTEEVTGRRQNGEEVPLEIALTAVLINNQWQGVGLLRDISARKEADAHLRQLSLAVEESPVSIVITDDKGCIEYVNPKFCQTSQYSREEVMGANPRVLKSGEQTSEHYQEMWRTLRAGKEWHGEFANRRKNGDLYWERASISPLRDEEGGITHFVAIKEDITREKEILANLQKSKMEAERANQAKSDFVANMSHEIRTPMNAIIGLSELALDMEMEAETKRYFANIHQAGRSLLGIINDILDFSKIEAGGLIIAARTFNINVLVDGLANLFSSKVWEKNLELMFQIEEDVPHTLLADDMRLTQVLINLIGNALKFTEHGEILVTIKKTSQGPGSVELEFSVQDSGIGIPPQHMADLFSPFQQADSSISRRYGGSGLGLTICKQLVELMGGNLVVRSEPGQGSIFSFRVPCQVQERTQQQQDFATPPALRKARVLVADDNETVGRIIADFLRAFDLRPTVVASGRAALEALTLTTTDDPFALLLIDWQMPDMDGLATIARIKANTRFTQLPIILQSGWNPQEFAQQAQGKVDAILSKPVTAQQLHDAILKALGLPARDTPAKRGAPVAPEGAAGRRVLLAEDNLINREVALKILTRAGFQVECVTNGTEVVAAVRKEFQEEQKEPLAAILMDIQMPQMDGLEATRQIRQMEKKREKALPIIAMTAQVFAADRAKCLAAGMDDFISKPIDQEHLFATLANHMQIFSPAAAPAERGPEPTSPEPSEADNQRAIDVEAVLKRLGCNKDFLHQLLSLFREEYSSVATLIRTAHHKGDRETASRLAHTIVGAGANLGADHLARTARTLQSTIEEEGDDFEEACISFSTALQAMLDTIDEINAQPARPLNKKGAPATANRQNLSPLFSELITLLRKNSYGARDILNKIKQEIPTSPYQEKLTRLSLHVENFQHQEALKVALTLQAQYSPTTTAD